MLEYMIISFIISLNLIIYLTISIPLDIVTYRVDKNSRVKGIKPEIKQNFFTTFSYISSLIIWLLFLAIPIENIIESNMLYNPLLANVPFFGIGLQIIGLCLIFCGTFVAMGGRISRGKRAFSWGVPIVLEKSGMYQYLRHPLYSSYFCYFVGFLFLLQHFFLIILLFGIPGYYNIAVYEEEILIQQFGQEYLDYQQRTKRFIPFLW